MFSSTTPDVLKPLQLVMTAAMATDGRAHDGDADTIAALQTALAAAAADLKAAQDATAAANAELKAARSAISSTTPIVNAGEDQSVDAGALVILSGTAWDPDGAIASYAWEQTDGMEVSLSADGAIAMFTAPGVLADEALTFRLTVADDAGETASDDARVVVQADDGDSVNRFISVSAGYHHTCGLLETGAVQCWGLDNFDQSTPPTGTFTAVSAGGLHTCGLLETGAVQCWGFDKYGQSTPAPAPSPGQEDDDGGNGNGGGDGRQVLYTDDGNPYYDLGTEIGAACPLPDDNTPYEGIRYWRGDACSRTITGECTGILAHPIYNCAQSCIYRFTYDHGTSYQRNIATGRLRVTCGILRGYSEATIQSCVPCDGW